MTKLIMVLLVLLSFNIMPQIVAGQVPPQHSSEPLPEEFFEQPTYEGDCRDKPDIASCVQYSDGYIWLLGGVTIEGFGENGSWNGKKIEVAYSDDGLMYDHILGTSYVGIRSNSSEPLPDEFYEQPSYDGSCQLKPETGNCINYSDGYIWHLGETVEDIVFDDVGSWNGKKIAVAFADNGCMYVHILGTSYVRHGCNSSEAGLDEATYWRLKAGQLSMKYSGCNPYPTQEQREETLEAYNKSIEFNPRDSGAWQGKGYVLSVLGRYEEAIRAIKKAIEIDPTDKNAIWQRDSLIRNYREPSMPATQQSFDEPLPDEFYESPPYDGDCMMNKPGNCVQYSDGYIWLLRARVNGYSDGGSWNGKKIEVANATNGCMYDHILGTSYVGVRCGD